MPSPENSDPQCNAELELAREFPRLWESYVTNPAVRPSNPEIWERILRVARNGQPILDAARAQGLDLLRIDSYTPPGTVSQPLFQAIVKELPAVEDPLTLLICLGRLGEPEARGLVKKNREMFLGLARRWNGPSTDQDTRFALASLARCVMTGALARDLPEILDWVQNPLIPAEGRWGYIDGLQRFARTPGPVRDTLVKLLNDGELGAAAVWALARALKAEALPRLQELQASSPHRPIRAAARAAAQKLGARTERVELPKASPAQLPKGYATRSSEFDTDHLPGLLSELEQAMRGRWTPEVRRQLVLAAEQLKRGQRRFYVVPFTFADGEETQLGFGLFGEDEDVLVVEIHFEARFRDAVEVAMRRVPDEY